MTPTRKKRPQHNAASSKLPQYVYCFLGFFFFGLFYLIGSYLEIAIPEGFSREVHSMGTAHEFYEKKNKIPEK